ASGNRREELAVLLQSLLLVGERLAQDLVDVVLVRFQQRSELERRVTAEIGDVLAGLHRVRLSLVRLGAEPRHDRDAVVAEDHETVVKVAHQSRDRKSTRLNSS